MATAKRRHHIKKNKPMGDIQGDFNIVACDLSLRCPGFALIHYDSSTRQASVLRKSCVKNRAPNRKCHGQILCEIKNEFAKYTSAPDVKVFIRERAFARYNYEVIVLNKVVGITDATLWDRRMSEFQELTPSEIKKHTTGFFRASKEEVAEVMPNYNVHEQFETDDESDACACGIAWLVSNGYVDAVPLPKYEETYRINTAKERE